jgi:hypothetical protein
MTRFLSTMRDNKINTDHIVELRSVKNPDKLGTRYITIAVMRDGRSEELAYGMDRCLKVCCSIFPAYPGFEVLSAWYDKEIKKTEVWRLPVIGWRVEELSVEAVTPDEDFEMSDSCAVRYPDGQVSVPFDRTYKNEQAWLENMTKVFEQQILDTAVEETATEKAAS